MSEDRQPRKTYAEAMNEWASREGRPSFTERSRISIWLPDPFSHPVLKILGYGWRLALVAALGFGVYWMMLRAHLGSQEFTTQVSRGIQSYLGAEAAELSLLSWEGDRASANRLVVTGGPDSFYRSLEAQDLSFRVPFGMIREKEWQLRGVDVGSLKVELRSGGLGASAVAAATEDEVDDALGAFTPPVVAVPGEKTTLDAATPDADLGSGAAGDKRVLDLDLMKDGFGVAPDFRGLSLGGVAVSRFAAQWGSSGATRGELRDASLSATRTGEQAWTIEVASGEFSQNWLRGLQVSELRASLDGGVLTVAETPVQWREATGFLAGQVRMGQVPVFDLTLKMEKLPLSSFCGDSAERVFGLLGTGELRLGGSTNLATGVTVTGSMAAEGGFVQGLALQQALADATRRIRFRGFEVTGGTVEFSTQAGRVEVKSFDLVSRADVRMRGSFTHAEGVFTGQLELGVDPGLLEKLAPPVLERFFPQEAEGKRWLSTRLDGPLGKLTEQVARDLVDAQAAAEVP